MKSTNLLTLRNNGINVPKFIIVKDKSEIKFNDFTSNTFAVRSSFGLEDGCNSSFAGQFDTILGVDKANVNDAFDKIVESYNSDSIKEYIKIKNISMDTIDYDVIIQEMIDADYSGVAFSSNPIGIINEIVVIVGNGTGNNVVEDKIDTTTYYYNKDDKISYYEQNEDSPILKSNIFNELIENILKIENIFNDKMDIEFAIKDDIVYILQARPITTLEKDDSKYIVLDNSNIVESYPNISLPITQDFVKEIYYKIFETLLLRISKDEQLIKKLNKPLVNMVDVANGHIYYRISSWYNVLLLLPFSKKIVKIWQEMLGVSNKKIVNDDVKPSFKTKLTIIKSFFHYLKSSPKDMEDLNYFFENKINDYREQIQNTNTIDELLKLYYNLRDELTSKWDITLVNDMYTFIYTALAGKKNKERISNIRNLESMKPVYSIDNIIKIAQLYGLDSLEYNNAKEKHIMEFGDRCLCELKLETKTYRTNPELLDEYIKSRLNDTITIPKVTNNKEKEVLFVKNAKIGIYNREISRMNRSRIFGIARAIFLKCGELLVEQQKIETKEDIFYLHLSELKNYKAMNYIYLIEERKDHYSKLSNLPDFGRLVFDKKVINKTFSNISKNIDTTTNTLQGLGSSLGKIKGEVILITEPNQSIDTTNKIVVTKSTDPGWVYLIKNSLGIIAEKGSLLSHTAIITRELKKPSIVNVKNITNLIKTGDIVELDAYNGVITILERK